MINPLKMASSGLKGVKREVGKGVKHLGPRSSSNIDILDGRKVKALLKKDEKEFDAFLGKYFELLDKDAGGTLDRDEMKPALVRFGELLGLPAPGTAAQADAMVDKLFTRLMADNLAAEIDKPSFITISKTFLTSVASNLEERPLVVHVFDGAVLYELAENEELFDAMVEDFFTEFDADGSGALQRDEILPALVMLGLVPPSGAKPETDRLLSQILGKYGGKDLELNRMDFKSLLKDLLRELSEELKERPVVLHEEKLPVLSVPELRKLLQDKKRLHGMADDVFVEWDTLKNGKITKSDVMKGFKDACQAYGVPISEEEQQESMCLATCLFMNSDTKGRGYIERTEFDFLLSEVLEKLALRMEELNPTLTIPAATSSSWLTGWLATTPGNSDSGNNSPGSPSSSSFPSADRTFSAGTSSPLGARTSSPTSANTSSPRASSSAASKASGVQASSSLGNVRSGAATSPSPSSSSKKPSGVPKAGSADAVKAKYGYQASEAVLKAREKAEERKKKLEKLAMEGDQLEADAAEFENLSSQLSEKMKKKWW